MTSIDTKYLKLRGNIWWYQRRIPQDLLDQFDGQTTISESLGTADIRIARVQRDILNGKLQERKFNAPNTNRHRFLELVQSMSEDKEHFPASWDEHYDLDKVQRDDDEVFLHAYTTVNGRKDHRGRYKITLKEALTNWSRKKANSSDNINKTKKSVDEFLKFLKLYDIQLEDISKRHVHDYVELLLTDLAISTVSGYISRLRSIWRYCDQLGEVTTPCPFKGHSFAGGIKTNKKKSFTPQELGQIQTLITDEEPIKKLLVKLAAYTGGRISELCNLKVRHLIDEDNITAIYIEKGKTDAATRIVPLTTELGERLKALANDKGDEDLLLGLNGKAMSRWFSRIKTAHISKDTAKSFHSFRVMFSTAMQRSEVIELKASAILGHERGKTMTYGYYSDGYTLPQLKEAYDQCVEHIIW
ncbi:integrase [Shewanella sp. 11B5]|uniref:tyrosine-type recombinase/integrase n=1 Tax=Shewanella sp. 11B5 TaxID=2058298 RepID=UPI000C79E79F|nr:tyrosine-type recombinase/integrase [Shewanella sp. 11B5]PKI03794.1 integrase [Shewanella sp. 11B5]